MRIQNFQEKNTNSVKALFEACFDENVFHSLDLATTVVGEVDGEALAVAGLIRNELHPNLPKVVVAVAEDFRRRGYGRLIHQTLLRMYSLKTEEIGVDGYCYNDQIIAQTFMRSLGYQKYLDCHMLILDLSNLVHAADIYGAQSYSESSQYGHDAHVFKNFLIKRYVEAHQWNPPCEMEHEIWNHIKKEKPNESLSFAICEGNRILAASEWYSEANIDRVSSAIGWFYAEALSTKIQNELLKVLLGTQLACAKKLGVTECYIELDSLEKTTQELLSWLPIKEQKVFERYRLAK